MKRLLWLCLIVVLLPAWAWGGVTGPARIRMVDSDVLFYTPDGDEWLPASINTPLDEGDSLWCPPGTRAEIQLPDGSIVRLDGGSQLDLLANEDDFVHLHLASGRLYLKTSPTSARDALQIDADDTTVLPSARTRLRLDMLPGSQEDVSIFKGSAYVEGSGSRTRVRAGEHISLEEGHSELLPLNPPDAWESWNSDRDRSHSRTVRSEKNLPEELRGQAADLEANGTWVDVPEYGRVWRPAVVYNSEWAPYRYGRWVWKGNDYVWISSEPWGWIPYHYGRWAVVSGFGWCWIPPVSGDVYWGPGFVGWYRTGSHVGWTPLAPGEVFYGYGNYGRHSVNVSSVNVSVSSVRYRNRDARGGLTVLAQGDFLRGTPVRPVAVTPSLNVSVTIGSPRIKPLRETRMPIVKQTPPRVAPPVIHRREQQQLPQRYPRIAPLSKERLVRPAPAAPAAAVPQPPAGHERRGSGAATPVAVTPAETVRPVQPAAPRRDERRQNAPAPQPTTQPAVQPASQPAPQPTAPAAPQAENRGPSPAGAGRDGQRPEHSPRADRPQRDNAAPTVQPQAQHQPQAQGQARPEGQRQQRQKKVWRVVTPEQQKEPQKEQKDQDPRNRGEHRR